VRERERGKGEEKKGVEWIEESDEVKGELI
jgi:hypothetical protein